MENICQSCGMPVTDETQKGSNGDGTINDAYCLFCFKDGRFTADVSMEQFIEQQVKIAQEKMGMIEQKARQMAESIIPQLERWRDS